MAASWGLLLAKVMGEPAPQAASAVPPTTAEASPAARHHRDRHSTLRIVFLLGGLARQRDLVNDLSLAPGEARRCGQHLPGSAVPQLGQCAVPGGTHRDAASGL